MTTKIFLPFAVVLFLLLAIPFLDKPGLHYDEALEAGLPAVQILNGQPVTAAHGVVLRAAGREWPLMVQNHIGALQVYAALPFIALGGPTATALRAMPVTVGVLTIIAVFLFLDLLYGRRAATYGSLWLATFPSFVFWSRQGVFVTSLAPFLMTCSFVAGVYWWRTRCWWTAVLVGLCAGLAVYSKISALWVINGSLVWFIIVQWMARRRFSVLMTQQVAFVQQFIIPSRTARRHGLLALLGFLAGISPLLLYNLLSGGATIAVVQANASRSYFGVDNLDVLGNLGTRFTQLLDVIRSGEHLWYLGGTFPNDLTLLAVVVALGALVVRCTAARPAWRALSFAPFVLLAVVLQSVFTISALWPTHFAVVPPLLAVVVGTGMAQLDCWTTRARNALRWAVPLGMTIVVVSQIVTSARYVNAVETTGGLSFHSSAIYDVARFLQGRSEQVAALDWGIAAQLDYLSGGRLQVEEIAPYQPLTAAQLTDMLRQRSQESTLYITHAAYQEAFPRRDLFLQSVAAAGLKAETVNVSIRADGWPMIEVWRVLPSKTASSSLLPR